jgi:hypothetical protein
VAGLTCGQQYDSGGEIHVTRPQLCAQRRGAAAAEDRYRRCRAAHPRAATRDDTTVGTTPSNRKEGMKQIISGSTLRTPTLRALMS